MPVNNPWASRKSNEPETLKRVEHDLFVQLSLSPPPPEEKGFHNFGTLSSLRVAILGELFVFFWKCLQGIEVVNSLVGLLSIDFHALEQDARKEQQMR